MMFHVEPNKIKTLFSKGFLVFIVSMLCVACFTQRHAIEIDNYILLDNGKKILGKQDGLTAFVFENNPRKIVFAQFVADKYGIGNYVEVNYLVNVDGYNFRVYVYDTDELQKYFDMGQFMVTKQENDQNVVGSKEHFIGVSVVNDANEDCLAENSLYRQIALDYLVKLKDEYNNL